MSEPHVVNAFLNLYLEDSLRGAARTVEHYQALFPGHEALIAGIYERCSRQSRGAEVEERIGRFEIVREIGRGGQGVVYLAEDTRLKRRVALKVLTGLRALTPNTLDRFLREARIASRLEHPGICSVYEASMEAGVPYIVMQYVEGTTLAKRISTTRSRTSGAASEAASAVEGRGHGPVPGQGPSPASSEPIDRAAILDAVRIVEKVARALHVAHEAGVVHRDVKPGNILVTPAREPVILDFGFARDDDPEFATITRSGDFFGTPAYMSPEQLARRAMRIDRRTDVWSLGVCLFEAVTLRRPFEAPTREALCQAILTESPPAPRRLAPAVPEDLSVVLETALEKDLDRRYRTAAAFADDLRAVLEHRPVAAKPIGPVGRLLRWAAREPAKAALLATVLVALPAISTLIALRINDLPRLEAHRAAEAQQRRDDEIAQGLRAGDEGAVEQAIRHYRAALEIDAGSVEAVIAMAIAQSGLGRKREALQTLEANAGLVGARRGAVALRRQLLRELEGTADDGSLLPECQDALDHFLEGYRLTHPADERDQEACKAAFVEFMSAVVLSNAPRKPYYTFALDAAARVKDTTAVRMLSDGLRHFWPGSASTHHALGVASFLAGRLDESLAEFVEAARLMPHHSMYRFALGKVYFHKGMLDESIAELRRSIELNRSYATSHDLLAHVLERKGSVDEALQEYRLAYGFDHDRKSFWTLLDALLRHRRLDQAAALYRDAAPRFSKDDDLHYGVGCTFGSAGLRTDAVKAYEKALEIRPDHVEAHINLGLALFNSGQSEAAAAIDHYRTAMRLRPSDIRIYPNFGLALMESGRVDEAIGVLRAGLGVKPDAAEVHCTLGRALMKHGEFEAALESMRRGHELGTNYPDWPYPSEEWVRRLDEMVAEERRMLRVAEGKETANGPADILRLAELAHDSRRWSLAANWYVSFPDGEHPLQPDQALKAAHAAVQAATGARTDSQASTTPATALHWRAREWLTRQLDTYGEVQKVAELLLSDPLFTSVRDEPSLSGLPPEEARAWREFWAEVRAAAR